MLQSAKDEAAAKAPASVDPVTRAAAPHVPPPPAQSRTEKADLPVSGGMSFLGLSEAPSTSSQSYLLDEEEERSVAWGRIFVVLILLAAAGGLGWQRYRGAYPFAPRTAASVTNSPAPAPAPIPAPAPADSSSSASITPAPSAEPAAPDASKTASEPAASTTPGTTESTPPATSKTEAPAEATQTPPATAETTPSAPEKKSAAPVEKAENVAPSRVKPPAPARTKAPEPVEAPGEALYVQGQRYLYGNGVAPNCDLALKSLLSAASRANSKAQSTLGAMYSTGHCVTRDLPTAYRWFAKALHQDPNNSRLEQDLNVVWRQMTPGERTSATRAE